MVAADHTPPRRLKRFRGYDLVQVTGGTQALRRTVLAELEIAGTARTTNSVPDAFGALILKAAAHRADTRDRERHLTDAAVLLACVDQFEERTSSGSDRSRLLHLAHLADPTAPPGCRCRRRPGATVRPRSTCSAADRPGRGARVAPGAPRDAGEQ